MTGNRLIERVAVAQSALPVTEDGLRERCWEMNQKMRRIGLDRWYMVSQNNEIPVIEPRDGAIADRVWQVLNGWYPDYHGWPEAKLASEYRISKHIARMGMPEDQFKQARLAA